ncbi:TetR/AcrR family transcriptional regulator [Sphingobium vermicomposti]|uniref:AcrR family transcriptional regulator n=1 Tax=Sphingobium vermicomposti TaxID=529005 RepID=A0A846M521_9SPHN|nr:TetR/AcrR family transcriptional regulator [Sphingobium vermicomposti]NIJ17317.1 AcrR family transcriptional regulator [Sphingobium vermicomposti]
MSEVIAPPALSRRDARRRDRRDAILEVAQQYFLEHGYAATTMSAIAATLGGSKGTLWNYFPNKEELFSAVLRRATAAYHARLARILDEHGELEPTLRCFASDLLRQVTLPESIALVRLAITEAGRSDMGAIFFEIAPRQTRALLAKFLLGAMERGQLRQADPERAALTLITLTLSGCHQKILWGQMDQPTAAQMESDVAFAVDCFLRAYAPETGTH